MEQIVEENNEALPEKNRPSGATFMESNEDFKFVSQLDSHTLESLAEIKLSRFFSQIGIYYPENLHKLIMQKVEKPLISQILKRTGGNQVQAARILGINRNTLRKKMREYDFLK
jgi:DNA-binding protein Fis